jgi:hypothetical protein
MFPVSKVLTGYTNEWVGRPVPVLITLLFTVDTFELQIYLHFLVSGLRSGHRRVRRA